MTQPLIPLPETDAPILPDWPEHASTSLPTPEATETLARRLSSVLAPGDTFLLSGALGAGKTHLARAVIRAFMDNPSEPVPSPTFTLVQIYEADHAALWHADLYRLTDIEEVQELGLDDAMNEAICLIEWPDRFAPFWPEASALLHLTRLADETRRASLHSPEGTPLASRLAAVMNP